MADRPVCAHVPWRSKKSATPVTALLDRLAQPLRSVLGRAQPLRRPIMPRMALTDTPPDWRITHAKKLCTAREAIRAIRPGRRILIGSGAAEPVALVEGLVAHGKHLADNEIVHLLTLGPAPYVQPEHEGRFRHAAFFIGANVREAVRQGRADFIPVFLSEIPEVIRSRRVRIDVALIQVTPPDRHGYVSLGVSVDIVRAAVEAADLVIAQVNPRMPWTYGDSAIPVSAIHHLVEVDAPILELSPPPPDEVLKAIGRNVATLVADGATIQVGIGGIPDAVLSSLEDRHDLGVHTEMLSDGIMRLALRGVITGARKTLLRGKIVTSFVMGTRALYEWAHEHPALEMRPSDFTNDPGVIARHDRMISINSALAVDLTGQVASDTVGGHFYSGIGGQVDFVRGASRSKGGKAIIALPSTAKKGTVSRIRATFEEGAGVVTSRGDVKYVVTEHGIADLWGKSVRERAKALIEIAHPAMRGDLLDAAKKRLFVFADQRALYAEYPWQEVRRERLRGGEEVIVRPVRMSDELPLQRMLYRLSDESVYRRFFAWKRAHPREEMQAMVDLDYEHAMGLVVHEPDSEEMLALCRYDVDQATRMAEIAFTVRDDWQHRGIGTMLLRRMTDIARARGLSGFKADVLSGNAAMLAVFHKSGLKITSSLREGIVEIEGRFE
jgi:acyl-CoA hydrolase/GNAT superfamily N-acetyltransferase